MERLAPERLRRTFSPESLGLTSTEHIPPLTGIIGQERAVAALQFGMSIREVGYNIYVAGPAGIGKMTAVETFLEGTACRQPTPSDWCYVFNFDDPYQPLALELPAGRGRQLEQEVSNWLAQARRLVPSAFEAEAYTGKRDDIIRGVEEERSQIQGRLTQQAAQAGFALQASGAGLLLVPILKGRPLKEAEFLALPAQVRAEFDQRREAVEGDLKAGLKELRTLERSAQAKLGELDRQIMLSVVGELLEDIRSRYHDIPPVLDYLDAIQKDALESIDLFKGIAPPHAPPSAEDSTSPSPDLSQMAFRKYQAAVLVDNSKRAGAPVILEWNPTYSNLFGRIEKEAVLGALTTDFTLVKPGAFHRANGGYLVLQIEDVLRNIGSWEGLKRALRARLIEMEDPGERLGYPTTKSIRPCPIPLDIKVVLIGPPAIYYSLHDRDEGFPELFKVKADFGTDMPANDENVRHFAEFVSMLCRKDKLRHLAADGIARLLEHSARMAEDQEKLSTHFGDLANLIRESNFWAAEENAPLITASHVCKAQEQKVFRSNLAQERLKEMMQRGLILLDTTGEKVGQVNGLTVIEMGDYAFGRPNRITASVGPGREGIVDIEREVTLAGPIYSKGLLILSGFLTARYAQTRPLSLTARLVFEQSYQGIEGDSASSAELYALLSALSGLPVHQGIAVTGSVNQNGEVQAVGGVNEKIEGFFEACSLDGLSGEQGVIIPRSNAQNLMLRDPVIAAVQEGRFNIWPVATVDEGIEIMTHCPAGVRDADGRFPPATVNFLVDQRLSGYAETIREFSSAH